MDIEFYGGNCLTISNKNVRIVIDDNLAELGGKAVLKAGDVALFTGEYKLPSVATKLLIDCPGEYEVSGVSIYGIPARAHTEETAVKNSTMYKLLVDDTWVLVTGHVYPELSESQLEDIGLIDILIIPIGGNGYTLDPTGALGLIKKIEPRMVIPTHYEDKLLQYPVPQQPLDDALKVLSLEVSQTVKKLKLKAGGFAEDTISIAVLEKS